MCYLSLQCIRENADEAEDSKISQKISESRGKSIYKNVLKYSILIENFKV